MNLAARILSFGVVAALAGGAYFLGQSHAAISQQPVSARALEKTAQEREVSRLRQELAALRTEVQTRPVNPPSPVGAPDPRSPARRPASPQTMDRIQVLKEIRTQRIGSFRLPILLPDGQVSPAVARLLGLNEPQVGEIQQAFNRARDEVFTRSSASATIAQADQAKLVIDIPPFQGGADIYDHLAGSLEQTLGTETFQAFMGLAGDDVILTLNSLGAEKRTLTVERRTGATTVYEVNETRAISGGERPLSAMTTFADPSKLPDQFRWMIRFESQIQQLQPRTPSPPSAATAPR